MERYKGRNLLEPQENYIVIDIETTDLNIYKCEVIEIAALKVSGGKVAEEFSSLVKPIMPIPRRATEINHISNEMVKDAPGISTVLNNFLSFIGDSVLVGHNISSFDLNILYDYSLELFGQVLNNNYVDTLTLAKRHIHNIRGYSLSAIAEYFKVPVENAHRAAGDCYTTYYCYEKLKRMGAKKAEPPKIQYSSETKVLRELYDILLKLEGETELSEEKVCTLMAWMEFHSHLSGNHPFDRAFSVLRKSVNDSILYTGELEEIISVMKECLYPAKSNSQVSSQIDFRDKVICLTGDFEYGSKEDIEKVLSELGAVCKSSVVRNTDILIIGSLGDKRWSGGVYGTKIKKALEMKEKGSEILILHEKDVFIKIQ